MDVNKYLNIFLEKTRFGDHSSDGHILSIFSMALGSKGKVYVELGVEHGDTTLPLILAAHMNGGHLYSVDIKETSFQCPNELKPYWTFMKGNALEFLAMWDKGTIDVVYVDDNHEYDHVKKELALIQKYTTPKSLILLHDLMYWRTGPQYHVNMSRHEKGWAKGGPFRAVNELNKRKWEWSTLPWFNGLTILRKKAPLLRESALKTTLKYWLRKVAPGTADLFSDLWKRYGPYKPLFPKSGSR